MEVHWSPEARSNLSAIYDQVQGTSLAAATRVVEDIAQAADRLNQFPMLGKPVPIFRHRQLRQLRVGRFSVVYHIGADGVTIIAVTSGAVL